MVMIVRESPPYFLKNLDSGLGISMVICPDIFFKDFFVGNPIQKKISLVKETTGIQHRK